MPVFETEERDREVGAQYLELLHAEAMEHARNCLRPNEDHTDDALQELSLWGTELANELADKELAKGGHAVGQDDRPTVFSSRLRDQEVSAEFLKHVRAMAEANVSDSLEAGPGGKFAFGASDTANEGFHEWLSAVCAELKIPMMREAGYSPAEGGWVPSEADSRV